MTSPGDKTLAAYEANTQRYIDHSAEPGLALRRLMDSFTNAVDGTRILELGTGPGWDADYLESRGMRVTRTDATPAFVQRLRSAGHDAKVLDVRRGDLGGPYDGIWANAVLLHLTRDELQHLLHRARGETGVIAFTVKEGDGGGWSTEKLDAPRHFTYWREEPLRELLSRTGWSAEALEHVDGRTAPWLHVVARPTGAIFDIISPTSDTGRTILGRYMGDVAGSYWNRDVSEDEIAQLMLDDPSDDLVLPTGLFIGAFLGGHIVGCAGLRLMGNGIGEITRVYAAPESRGHGVGAQLVAQVERHAVEAGLSQLRLDTRTDLVAARRLYTRLGYTEVPAFNAGRYAQHWYAKSLVS